jgi:hypothetical protein
VRLSPLGTPVTLGPSVPALHDNNIDEHGAVGGKRIGR